jgi:hypothetical protein
MPAPTATTVIQTFQPDKRTLGVILSNTSPPIRVPEFQRDYSWEKEQIEEFWADLSDFAGAPTQNLQGKEYFLGAAVLVNNGSFHLLLDGQQRLATATILLAALRDKIASFKADAADQIQNSYITFQDHLTGDRVYKIVLNIFDNTFFRDFIQAHPRVAGTAPTKKSHHLIKAAYDYFTQRIQEQWDAAGGGRDGFNRAARIAQIVREHLVLVTVISNDEKSAGEIFTTLNDRGIGLSTVDLVRSMVLQRAATTTRPEIIEKWDEVFDSCGRDLAAEALLRMSWVANHGDVKSRSLYKIVSDAIEADVTPLSYSQRIAYDAKLFRRFRDGESDDSDVQQSLKALRTLKFNAAYPLLFSSSRSFSEAENKQILKALISLVVRHNVICGLDRAKIESTVYATAKLIADGANATAALVSLRAISPSDDRFANDFGRLSFAVSEHNVARYVLSCIDVSMGATQEVSVAGADRVHVEHIYPQNPPTASRWAEHEKYLRMIGNLTLLDRRLNESIKNADFNSKKQNAYSDSRLEITKSLLPLTDWTPDAVVARQAQLGNLAQLIWPASLI